MSNNGIPPINDWQSDNYPVVYDEGEAKIKYVKTGVKIDATITATGGITLDPDSPETVTLVWAGSQAQYDALTPTATTLYFITS
jgi:hypothetical protein